MRISIRESQIDPDYYFWVLRDDRGRVLDSGTSETYEGASRMAQNAKRHYSR